MTKRLIIYLHSIEPQQLSWLLTENGVTLQSVLRGSLAEIPPSLKQHDTTVFVPAQDILLTQTTLPKMSQQRLMQALPFALEEQLVDDVNSLHFAIAHPPQNGNTFVAVTSRKKMDDWLTLLKQYDIIPIELYSAVFASPYAGKNWSLSVLPEIGLVRLTQYDGFAAEHNNVNVLLELALKETVEKPDALQIYTMSASSEMKITALPTHQTSLTEQAWLEKLPGWLDAQPGINLLQGTYRAKHKTAETKKIWLTASVLTLAWIGLLFFSHLVSFFILAHKAKHLETAIHVIYKKNFPEATSVVAPRERMQNKLTTLTNQANKNYFLVLLARSSHELAAASHIQLKSMDFRDNQLNLELVADKFDDLDRLTKSFLQQNLHVKQQNAAIAGTKVKANLVISRGAS